ncbi:hypothetical protein L596_008718 [Steinernema carpocapsae]|uniref:Uncharacterized protein n=1 Tax=Steinernema carpocapsae TaxID=34508 RepID=A0A4U5PDB9_STECR|nr:hypothetical protein L596_008718 [Steinernema carpocapsae]
MSSSPRLPCSNNASIRLTKSILDLVFRSSNLSSQAVLSPQFKKNPLFSTSPVPQRSPFLGALYAPNLFPKPTNASSSSFRHALFLV